MMQNIYDNYTFFSNYKSLRETDNNYNVLLEQPAMINLIPDIKNKTVLDLGCGFGDNCKDFISIGAKNVVGIDISHNMFWRINRCSKLKAIIQNLLYPQFSI